jgi:hypothetical protein
MSDCKICNNPANPFIGNCPHGTEAMTEVKLTEEDKSRAKEFCKVLGGWGCSAPYGGNEKAIELTSQAFATQRQKYEQKLRISDNLYACLERGMEKKEKRIEELESSLGNHITQKNQHYEKVLMCHERIAEMEQEILNLKDMLGEHREAQKQHLGILKRKEKKIQSLREAGDGLVKAITRRGPLCERMSPDEALIEWEKVSKGKGGNCNEENE